MIFERNNVWARVGTTIHRVAFSDDGGNVSATCEEAGRSRAFYHVCEEAGPDAAPAVHAHEHCSACIAARSSLCTCGFRTTHDPRSAAFHIAHRSHHWRRFPACDELTLKNLDRLVEIFIERELCAGVLQPPVDLS